MADTEEVFAKLKCRPGVTYRGRWLNTRGLDRAVGIKNLDPEGVLHVTASETFVKRNTNRSIDETFSELPDSIAHYKAAGINTASRSWLPLAATLKAMYLSNAS
jgi:hydroxymethylglutaryl-CoA lyase